MTKLYVCLFTILFMIGMVHSDSVCRVNGPNACQSGACFSPSISLNGTNYSLKDDFLVVAFGDFSFMWNSGDIEGRLAVGGSANLGQGSTIGKGPQSELITAGPNANAVPSPYAFINVGSSSWVSGGLYPDGTGVSQQENACSGDASGVLPFYLQERFNPQSPSCVNEFQTQFFQAKNYFSSLSAAFNGLSVNTVTNAQGSTVTFDCSASASRYVAVLPASTLNQVTILRAGAGCSSTAQWVVNVVGSEDVSFTGDAILINTDTFDPFNFPFVAEVASRTVFNFVGSNRQITLGSVYGSILAPNNNIVSSGTIFGYVVGNNLQLRQVNILNCGPRVTPPPPPPCVSIPYSIDDGTPCIVIRLPVDVPPTTINGGAFNNSLTCTLTGTLAAETTLQIFAAGFTYSSGAFDCLAQGTPAPLTLAGSACCDSVFSANFNRAVCPQNYQNRLSVIHVNVCGTAGTIIQQAQRVYESLQVQCTGTVCISC